MRSRRRNVGFNSYWSISLPEVITSKNVTEYIKVMAVHALEDAISDISSRLGFEIQLKSEQRKSIISLLGGEDVIAILPMGYGKSLIFQLYILSPTRSLLHQHTSTNRV